MSNKYYDTKTQTHYLIYKKGYEISNNAKYIYLRRVPKDEGFGAAMLQFSIDYFENLILSGEFILIKQ